MKSGSRHNDFESSPGQSFGGSFRMSKSGLSQNELGSSPGQSFDGSFRKAHSASSKFVSTSRRMLKGLKDYGKKVVDLEIFTQNLEDWVQENLHSDSGNEEDSFRSPFGIDELHRLDLALEGVLFQQLFRMPYSAYASNDLKEDEYLTVEDFLHAIINGLWRAFWRKSGPLPFFVACPRRPGSKFHTVEKAISRGRLEELRGLALLSRTGGDVQAQWDQVAEFVLFKPDILSGKELKLSGRVLCEALFYGFHILLSRRLSKVDTDGGDSVLVLVLDSKFGGVVKFGGDIGQLELNSGNPYQSVADWIKLHAEVSVSPVDRIWNKLGNANWGDLGTLQIILATFNSIVQWNGPPRKSIASLASDHSLRLQKRRMEFCIAENGNAMIPYQHGSHQQGEIVELEEIDNPTFRNEASRLVLKQGEVLLLDDQREGQKGFRIHDTLLGGNFYLYSAISLDHPVELLALYVGAHPSRLEPSWEDMSLWYQVQRQTKVLNILKQKGVSSKYLPEIVSFGRMLHSGPCKKQSTAGRCDHPLCGTPILVTSPVGEPLSYVLSRDGPFTSEEALHCCRDCLAALRSAGLASIQHGDICPENIICVREKEKFSYVPISWGRAVLEDRDSPAINLQFSSSHALQHGKLCPSSDAESLVYLLFFITGGSVEQQDSIESALQWRERSWAKRVIQQQLGEVSALLKAFADYVDSLCGTPYPVDYDIWLKRLNKAVDGLADRGKMIEEAAVTLRLEDVAGSSGTSAGGLIYPYEENDTAELPSSLREKGTEIGRLNCNQNEAPIYIYQRSIEERCLAEKMQCSLKTVSSPYVNMF